MITQYTVYHISHSETGAIVYIGVTKDLEQRAKGHLNAPTDTGKWIRTIIKDGHKPVFAAIEKINCEHAWQANNNEKIAIAKFRSMGHNLFNRDAGKKKRAQLYEIVDNV